MAETLLNSLEPFQVGGQIVNGSLVVQMVNELISQIRGGGNRFRDLVYIGST